MKNGHYWLQFLTEKERVAFVENYELEPIFGLNEFLEKEFESFKNFLMRSFDWWNVKQELVYWSNIANRETL